MRTLCALALLAQHLIIDGASPGDTTCPGGTVTAGGAECLYGGEHSFDRVQIRNGGVLRMVPFDGTDRINTGNLVPSSPITPAPMCFRGPAHPGPKP